MNTASSLPLAASGLPAAPPVPAKYSPDDLPDLPDALKPLAREVATYFNSLPELVAAGNEGRYALIRGADVVSLWDTFEDAYQAGRAAFGAEPFLAQLIAKAHLEKLAQAHSSCAVVN